MPRNEDFDWLFDYVLQFLESDKFDCFVMDFVDEKCFVFEDEDENKLIYTDIHREFCEHIEALLNSNLGELGVSPEVLLESCERARSGRDINATVFERLVAMDDFQTFKKLMTKRNLELQLESIRSFKQSSTPAMSFKKTASAPKSPMKSPAASRADGKASGDDDDDDDQDDYDQYGYGGDDTGYEALIDPEELLALKEAQLLDIDEANLQEDEIQELLFQSLIEMEMIHRQEELEHAELERALMLSLAVEEERLREMVSNMKVDSPRKAEHKSESKEDSTSKAESVDSKLPQEEKRSSPAKKKITAVASNSLPIDSFADIKPLKLKPLKAALPLPSLSKAVAGDEDAERMVNDLEEKRKSTEDALRRNQQQLQSQKRTEEDLRKQMAGIDPDEAERRTRHMQEQRELLIAKKKAERERRVQAEDEKKKKIAAGEQVDEKPVQQFASPQKTNDSKEDPSNDEIAEMRRATMRAALARRLKMDLLEGDDNDAKNSTQNPLRQLDQLREDNRKREIILSQQLQKQQGLMQPR